MDQTKIDKALEIIRPYYDMGTKFHYVEKKQDFSPGGLDRFLKCTTIEYGRADIIVGDEPAETLNISGYFYNQGNIIVINDGVLNIINADFNLDGRIIVANYGEAVIDSSTLTFLQHYIYHHGVIVTDTADFSMTNSETSYNGYPLSMSIQGASMCLMRDIVNQDWTTAVVAQNATAYLENIGITGEWLFADDCFAQFKHVDNFLTWYFFPDSSVVDFIFPDVDTVFGFYMDSTLSNVSGIGYHVEIDSSTNCMWAAIPLGGSDVTISDSELRVTGLMFEGVDSFDVSGLVNGQLYADYTLPVHDRNYHLINTFVQTWNLYPSDTVNFDLSSSIFGELCGFSNSYTTIQNAFCDGSGGHIEASHNAVVLVILSSISADVITKDRGICLVGYCAMPWGNIWATGSSILILVNTQFPEEPIPSDTSVVFVAAVTGPSNASTEDTVGIIGSAWVDIGPFYPYDFDHYRVFYRMLGDSIWIPLGSNKYSEIRRDTLDYWNTVGLEPGDYEIRLVLKNENSDSIDAMKLITLRPTGIGEMKMRSRQNCFRIKRVGPRIFYINTNYSKADIRIYDVLGRQVQSIKSAESYWNAPSGGIFFIQERKSKITQKIIVH
jgi:hypothetical protein